MLVYQRVLIIYESIIMFMGVYGCDLCDISGDFLDVFELIC